MEVTAKTLKELDALRKEYLNLDNAQLVVEGFAMDLEPPVRDLTDEELRRVASMAIGRDFTDEMGYIDLNGEAEERYRILMPSTHREAELSRLHCTARAIFDFCVADALEPRAKAERSAAEMIAERSELLRQQRDRAVLLPAGILF